MATQTKKAPVQDPETSPPAEVPAPVEVKPAAPTPGRTLTYGEKACGVGFNPSGSAPVDILKNGLANMVDLLHNMRDASFDDEVRRMYSIAITEIQTGQMWAVKAMTWRG